LDRDIVYLLASVIFLLILQCIVIFCLVELNVRLVLTADAGAGEGHDAAAPTVSSTTPSAGSVLQLIQSVVMQILQQCVSDGAVLDLELSTYASILADTFYDQQQSRNAGGAVALTDSTLTELATFVRRNVDLRRRRTSL